LLVAKKRYAGLLWTKPDKADKKDVKGMESVRRDNCLLVKNVIDKMIEAILKDRDVKKMVEIVIQKVEAVAKGTVDLAELVISKSLSKAPKDYYPVPPQAMVAMKMAEENPNTAPKMGDRVPYIITQYGGKKEKVSKKAEHPIKVITDNMPVDKSYYIDRQLRKPCERILEPLIPGITARIFSPYASTIYIPTTAEQFARKPEAVAPPPKPAPPKKKTASGPNAPKGLFNGQAPKQKKAPAILAGQKNIMGQFIRPVERDVTAKKEGLSEIRIHHTFRNSGLSTTKGSIGNFVLVAPRCLACNNSMDNHAGEEDEAPAYCDSCVKAGKEDSKKEPVPMEDLPQLGKMHTDYVNNLWNICVGCQQVESVEKLRDCGTWECPNFFRRLSARTMLRRIEQKLRRFEVYLEQRPSTVQTAVAMTMC
jgi:hypothetical protein